MPTIYCEPILDPYIRSAVRSWEREQAMGLAYLDWLFGAEAAVCDHVWRDESYGNAETGCVYLVCTRCGAEHEVTLY